MLVEEYGYTRIAYADKLRDFLYALNPIVGDAFDGDWVKVPTPIRLREVIDEYGWDGYKETEYVSEIRPLLQRLGTEAGRETLWDSIWIDAAFHDLDPNGKYVITDARFPNEAKAIYDRGGEIWRINREGNSPAVMPDGTVHRSETSLDDWDFDMIITNRGSLERFHAVIRDLAEEYK